MKKKIFISTTSFGEYDKGPLEKLKKEGFEVKTNPYGRQLKTEETKILLKEVVGLIAGTEELSEDVLKSAGSLKAISRCGAGMDNVDIDVAKKLGIEVANTPNPPVESVAELALGMILAFSRRISQQDKELKSGKWRKTMGSLISGKTIGIVGLGRIGRRVAELAAPFNMKIMACETSPDKEFVKRFNIKLVSLGELFEKADIVTLHLSLSPETRHLIGSDMLSRMKKEAILVNTSRGEIVDEKALIEALKSGRIAGACLDVFEKEPYSGELQRLENVLLTPHIGTYAKETRIMMESEAADNIIKILKRRNV